VEEHKVTDFHGLKQGPMIIQGDQFHEEEQDNEGLDKEV
jgi:hypothetical protein